MKIIRIHVPIGFPWNPNMMNGGLYRRLGVDPPRASSALRFPIAEKPNCTFPRSSGPGVPGAEPDAEASPPIRVKPHLGAGEPGADMATVGSPEITAPDAPDGTGIAVSAPSTGIDEFVVNPVISETCSFFVTSFFLALPLFFVRGASRNSVA
jgi:hypothetical protein